MHTLKAKMVRRTLNTLAPGLLLCAFMVALARADSYTLLQDWPSSPLPVGCYENTAVALTGARPSKILHLAQRNASIPYFLAFDAHNGTLLYTYNGSGVASPHGLAANTPTSLWVADLVGCRVVELNDTGGHVNSFGTCGKGLTPPQFSQVADIAISRVSNDVFVSDGDGGVNNRLMRVRGAGNYSTVVRSAGSAGSGTNKFNSPHSIAADTDDIVFVADQGNSRLVIMDGVNGSWLATWDSARCFAGGAPWGVRVDPARQALVIVDGAAGTLWVFRVPPRSSPQNCTMLHRVAVANGSARRPHELAVDTDTGDVYVALAGTPSGVIKFQYSAA